MTYKKGSLSPLSPNALERWRQNFMWRLRLVFSSYKKSRGPQSPRHRRSAGAFTWKTHVFYAMTIFFRSTAFLSPWRGQFQFVNLYMWEGRGRLTCETTYVNNVTLRYVTFWYLSLRHVTMRYVTDAAWGFFHDTCKRGYYSRCQRMQQGRNDNVIFFMLTTWSSN